MEKPIVQLTGQDGNAFAVLGACRKAARKAGWSLKQILEFTNEAQAGDFNHMLRTCMQHFEVE